MKNKVSRNSPRTEEDITENTVQATAAVSVQEPQQF
jgi:hypothetical protein